MNLVNTEADLNQKTKGTILLSGDRYKLNVLGITRLFDGTKLYTISPEDEEITISTGESNDTDTVSPSEMLRFFNSGYDVKNGYRTENTWTFHSVFKTRSCSKK